MDTLGIILYSLVGLVSLWLAYLIGAEQQYTKMYSTLIKEGREDYYKYMLKVYNRKNYFTYKLNKHTGQIEKTLKKGIVELPDPEGWSFVKHW